MLLAAVDLRTAEPVPWLLNMSSLKALLSKFWQQKNPIPTKGTRLIVVPPYFSSHTGLYYSDPQAIGHQDPSPITEASVSTYLMSDDIFGWQLRSALQFASPRQVPTTLDSLRGLKSNLLYSFNALSIFKLYLELHKMCILSNY